MVYNRAVLTFEAWGSWVPERRRLRGSRRGPGRCRAPSPRWTCPAARTVRPPRSPTPSSGSPPRTSPSTTAGSGASHLKRQWCSALMVRSHCPTPTPIQTTMGSIVIRVCVGVCAVWTAAHNSIKPILYRSLYLSLGVRQCDHTIRVHSHEQIRNVCYFCHFLYHLVRFCSMWTRPCEN